MPGIVFALLASLGFGGSAVLARLGMRHLRATTGTLLSLVVSTAATLIIALTIHSREIIELAGVSYLWFFLAGLLSFPVGRLLNYTGVSLAGVSRGSTIVGAAPLFAMALAVTLGGESLNLPILLGTVSIIAGLGLVLSQQ